VQVSGHGNLDTSEPSSDMLEVSQVYVLGSNFSDASVVPLIILRKPAFSCNDVVVYDGILIQDAWLGDGVWL